MTVQWQYLKALDGGFFNTEDDVTGCKCAAALSQLTALKAPGKNCMKSIKTGFTSTTNNTAK